ncbi:cysteine dioxygenase [Geodermatophilus sp. SYSU D00766]
MPPLTSLLSDAARDQLTTDTTTARTTSAATVAAALAAVAEAWLPRVEYRAESRWTGLLPAEDAAALLDPALAADVAGAQVWLLTWLPGQGTPLHDHGGSAGAFAVVRGTLTEDTVGGPVGAVREARAELTAGRVRPFGPHHVHRVANRGTAAAVSVHAYTPGLRQMSTYDLEGGVLLHTGTERAGVDW